MMIPTRPVLRYHGGKWRLAPWILEHMPPHKIYVEPFGGAASVLLQKKRVQTEVYNDLDEQVVSLFRVLQDSVLSEKLATTLRYTLFSRAEFDLSYEPTDCPVEQARRLIVRSFFGYGSKSCMSATQNGFRCLRTGDNSPAVDWSRYPDALAAIIERFHGVVVEQAPALDVLRRFDRPETLFYVDPPYVHGCRTLHQGTYRHELSDDDHRELATALHSVRGMVILSGYPSELYRELYGDWTQIQRTAYADKASKRTEVLWFNPTASAARPRLLQMVGGGA